MKWNGSFLVFSLVSKLWRSDKRYKNVSSLAQKLSEVSIFQMQEIDLLERKHLGRGLVVISRAVKPLM